MKLNGTAGAAGAGGGLTSWAYFGMGAWRRPRGGDECEMELKGDELLEAAPAARAAALLMSDKWNWYDLVSDKSAKFKGIGKEVGGGGGVERPLEKVDIEGETVGMGGGGMDPRDIGEVRPFPRMVVAGEKMGLGLLCCDGEMGCCGVCGAEWSLK